MREGQASRTAERVAMRRAAHQLYDDAPLVFADPLAVRVLPTDALAELREREAMERTHPFARGMRAFLCARSRFAEDALERAVANGVRQYVVLGAGLDTFGARAALPECSAGLQELLMECGFMRVEDLDGGRSISAILPAGWRANGARWAGAAGLRVARMMQKN